MAADEVDSAPELPTGREIQEAASELKTRTGKSYAQMAREIGVAPGTFRNYRSSQYKPARERARRIREVLELQ